MRSRTMRFVFSRGNMAARFDDAAKYLLVAT